MACLIIPRSILNAKGIPTSTKLVLAQLLDHRNNQTGQCNPKVRTLAFELGISERTVQYSLRRLERLGQVSRRQGRRCNFYTVQCDTRGANTAPEAKQGVQDAHRQERESCTPRAAHPLYEPDYKGEPIVGTPQAKTENPAPIEVRQPAPAVALKNQNFESYEPPSWADFLNPRRRGRFLSTAEWQQLGWAMVIENNQRRNAAELAAKAAAGGGR